MIVPACQKRTFRCQSSWAGMLLGFGSVGIFDFNVTKKSLSAPPGDSPLLPVKPLLVQ
jgi:hypothetical protein